MPAGEVVEGGLDLPVMLWGHVDAGEDLGREFAEQGLEAGGGRGFRGWTAGVDRGVAREARGEGDGEKCLGHGLHCRNTGDPSSERGG